MARVDLGEAVSYRDTTHIPSGFHERLGDTYWRLNSILSDLADFQIRSVLLFPVDLARAQELLRLETRSL